MSWVPIFKFADSFLLSTQVHCWDSLVNFSCKLLYFPMPEFLFLVLFLFVYSLALDILYLVKHCSHAFLWFFRHGFLEFSETANLCLVIQHLGFLKDIFYWFLYFPRVWPLLSYFYACLIISCWQLDILENIMWQFWNPDSPLSPGFLLLLSFVFSVTFLK